MVKMCDSGIAKPLCLIYEKSMMTGTFPDNWKKANVPPIHKKESRQIKKNYRPISLLPICGKICGNICEKITFYAIYEHLTDNQLPISLDSARVTQLLISSCTLHTELLQLLKSFHHVKLMLYFLIYLRHLTKSGMTV